MTYEELSRLVGEARSDKEAAEAADQARPSLHTKATMAEATSRFRLIRAQWELMIGSDQTLEASRACRQSDNNMRSPE
jgi:hypothetical protein